MSEHRISPKIVGFGLREPARRAYEVLIQVQSPDDWDDLRAALTDIDEEQETRADGLMGTARAGALTGWTCQNCGAWVPMGQVHS
jgi:hypothetical protein